VVVVVVSLMLVMAVHTNTMTRLGPVWEDCAPPPPPFLRAVPVVLVGR